MMKFNDTAVSKSGRFSIGIVEPSGKYYISIPVSNRMADYEEYYEVDILTYTQIAADLATGNKLADKCRRREMDERLILKPGLDRGVPS
jgi:hypothetical protein